MNCIGGKMKQYTIEIPERLQGKEQYIKEYIIIKQWQDHILSSGACAKLLDVEKFDFQDLILEKHGLSFME